MKAYETLKQRWHRAARLREAQGVLGWDQAVLMPPGGAVARAEQLSTLAVLTHELTTQADTADLLMTAQQEDLNDWDRRNLALISREYTKETCLPEALVQDLAESQAAAEQAWGRARDADDFELVRAELQTSFDLTQERAQRLADRLGGQPYDLLMDDFEPGLTMDRVDQIFADYSASLPEFLSKVQAKQAKEPEILVPEGPFAIADQESLGRALVQMLGFDFDKGRLDVSRHPFCGGYPTDVRITTRYDEADFTKALMGVIHETGHALYESGLPANYLTQPVGQAAGLAAHESQSLLMEMQACRSSAFLSYLIPKARAHFKGTGPAWSEENLQRLYRKVAPGLIRVDADEVTYPAHVILRYELEKALFAGDLKIDDLPGAFADGLESALGVRPPSALTGVLQDIHWYSGGFGYFPTYTLGAMGAAQLFAAAKQDLSTKGIDLDAALREGRFAPLVNWLRTHVHALGSFMHTDEILTAATGRALDPQVFKDHLAAAYL